MDAHLLFAQIGQQLGLLPVATVAAAFANYLGPDPPGHSQEYSSTN
jgi:hypothetical protein